jgi:hypothetical protein
MIQILDMNQCGGTHPGFFDIHQIQ